MLVELFGCLFGHSWGAVTEQRYQYCAMCGKARVAQCAHRWKIIKTTPWGEEEKGEKAIRFTIYTLQCELCGELDFEQDRDPYPGRRASL